MSGRKEKSGESPPDRLNAAQISESLGESVIGRRIIVLKSTRSTNEFLLQALTPELPEGFVVFAEHQTAGRGQRGHRWESAPYRGLWFSILLRPRIPIVESARLTNWAAQAVAATIRSEIGLEATIKLPNDVYVAGRKVAGVLVETKAGLGSEWTAVAGIGVNVN
nr:biotin--[acetyl-CoA-carboxylase] ligase [Chthoniobacterales bacterium]